MWPWVHMIAFREEIVTISDFKGEEGTIWGKGNLHMVFFENQSKHIQRQQNTGGKTLKQNVFFFLRWIPGIKVY